MSETESEHGTVSDRVEAALRAVRDPDAGMNVFDAGLVVDIRVSGEDVTIEADLAAFGPGEEKQIMGSMMRAASSVEGIERAHVEHAVPDTQGRDAGVDDIDRIVAVASAKGGVGKTTVAANLACALAPDGNVGLFDADIHGPNVPSMLGVSGPVYSDDDGHPLPVDLAGMEVMSVGLMEEGAPLAWRGAMAHDALTELFDDTAWDDRDTLVIDLPPGTGDAVLTTLQEVPVDGVVFVTTPFHAAVTDTQRSIALFEENDVPVLGVVANMGTFTCDGCGENHEMYDRSPLADVEAPIIAELPFTPELQGTPRPGAVPASIEELADSVVDRYDELWNVTVPDDALDLRGVPPEGRHAAVEEAFAALDPGDPFRMVSDRDPSPVLGYLADLAGVDRGELGPVEVRQQNPETWFLRAAPVRS